MPMYLRFVVAEIDEDSERALGVFHAIGYLHDAGKLHDYEEEQHDIVRWWFSEKLERPPRFTRAYAKQRRKTNPKESRFLRLERETGFEPATSTLARSHSTAEL